MKKDIQFLGLVFVVGFAFYLGHRTAESLFPKPPITSVICIEHADSPFGCGDHEPSSKPTEKPFAQPPKTPKELVF